MIGQTLAAQAATFLAVLLIVSSLHKLWRWPAIRSAARALTGLPSGLGGPAVACAVAVELLGGIFMLSSTWRVTGAVLTVIAWSGYTGLLLGALLQGRRNIDCGCSFGVVRHELGAFEVGRNLLLVGIAGFVAWSGVVSAAVPVVPSQWLAAFALLALYGAIDQVMALAPLRSGEVV